MSESRPHQQLWLDLWLRENLGLDHTPRPEELRGLQMDRLRRTLVHAAANSPFYRERLRHIQPEGIRQPDDLARLPRTRSQDLRTRPEAFLAVSQDEVARVVSVPSSGTSGPGKRVFYAPGDLERIIRFFGLGMRNLLRSGESALILLPGERPGSVGLLMSEALASFGARAVIPEAREYNWNNPQDGPDAILTRIQREQVRCIVGTPAHLHVLAAHWAAKRLPRDQIRTILLCWDAVPEQLARNVEFSLGCRVFQHWGMVETGLGGAVSCGHAQGMHLREAEIFVEITDPDSGTPLPDGQWGEIVVTTLNRRAMPLIRYRTGDRGRILPEPCACASPLRRLDTRVRRLHDALHLPGAVRISMAELAEALYAVPELVDFHARLVNASPEQTGEGITADVLFVEISTLAPENKARCVAVLHAATQAVGSLPALARALEQGLRLEVRTTGHHGPARPGLGKRVLRQPAEQRQGDPS
ncbi:MAG: DVU_1553 family AMP-dependent CoA ligase [Desulfovibrio sp.]